MKQKSGSFENANTSAKSQEEAQKVHAERQRQSQIELERIRNLKTKALLNKPF